MGLSVYRNIHDVKEQTKAVALKEARANFNKDMAFRLYVKPTADSPPNPYLAHLPHRDLATASGGNLTLLNPAYALRQIMEANSELYGSRESSPVSSH